MFKIKVFLYLSIIFTLLYSENCFCEPRSIEEIESVVTPRDRRMDKEIVRILNKIKFHYDSYVKNPPYWGREYLNDPDSFKYDSVDEYIGTKLDMVTTSERECINRLYELMKKEMEKNTDYFIFLMERLSNTEYLYKISNLSDFSESIDKFKMEALMRLIGLFEDNGYVDKLDVEDKYRILSFFENNLSDSKLVQEVAKNYVSDLDSDKYIPNLITMILLKKLSPKDLGGIFDDESFKKHISYKARDVIEDIIRQQKNGTHNHCPGLFSLRKKLNVDAE